MKGDLWVWFSALVPHDLLAEVYHLELYQNKIRYNALYQNIDVGSVVFQIINPGLYYALVCLFTCSLGYSFR